MIISAEEVDQDSAPGHLEPARGHEVEVFEVGRVGRLQSDQRGSWAHAPSQLHQFLGVADVSEGGRAEGELAWMTWSGKQSEET
jgi:hypothetical protein